MRYLVILFIVSLSLSGANAQVPSKAGDRIQDEKVAFFNKELDLTKAEEKAFWPLYNDYQNRKNRIVAEKRTLMRYYTDNAKNISDQEVTGILEKYIRLEKDEITLLENYNTKFRQILPDEKVLRIYISEVGFKDYLLKRLRTN